MTRRRETALKLLLAGCIGSVIGLYLVLLPRQADDGTARTLAYLVLGWIPYALSFYAVGRLYTTPERLPSMRPGDVGFVLFSLSVLLSLGLDSLGFPPELVPLAHVPSAIGVYVGLALLGWGLGRRSSAIELISEGAPE